MISVLNYFRRLHDLSKYPAETPSLKQELHEILCGLPVGSSRFIGKIIEDEKVDLAEIDQIKDFIYQAGVPGGDEIRLLFEIHDHVIGHKNAPHWEQFFLNETTKYFTGNSNAEIKLPLSKAAMLYNQLKKTIKMNGGLSDVEMALLRNLKVKTVDFESNKGIDKLFLSGLLQEVLQVEKVDFNEIEMLKEMINQNTPPLEEDVEMLFEINLAINNKLKDDFWQVLFVESVSVYMINKPYEINNRKISWLESNLQTTTEKYQRLTPEEIELIKTLKEQTNEFPSGLNHYWVTYCQ